MLYFKVLHLSGRAMYVSGSPFSVSICSFFPSAGRSDRDYSCEHESRRHFCLVPRGAALKLYGLTRRFSFHRAKTSSE
eukprot:6190519-Pleurochrysis_carterae.AAC.2